VNFVKYFFERNCNSYIWIDNPNIWIDNSYTDYYGLRICKSLTDYKSINLLLQIIMCKLTLMDCKSVCLLTGVLLEFTIICWVHKRNVRSTK